MLATSGLDSLGSVRARSNDMWCSSCCVGRWCWRTNLQHIEYWDDCEDQNQYFGTQHTRYWRPPILASLSKSGDVTLFDYKSNEIQHLRQQIHRPECLRFIPSRRLAIGHGQSISILDGFEEKYCIRPQKTQGMVSPKPRAVNSVSSPSFGIVPSF